MTLISRTISRYGHRLLLAMVLTLTFGGLGAASVSAAPGRAHSAPASTAPQGNTAG